MARELVRSDKRNLLLFNREVKKEMFKLIEQDNFYIILFNDKEFLKVSKNEKNKQMLKNLYGLECE